MAEIRQFRPRPRSRPPRRPTLGPNLAVALGLAAGTLAAFVAERIPGLYEPAIPIGLGVAFAIHVWATRVR